MQKPLEPCFFNDFSATVIQSSSVLNAVPVGMGIDLSISYHDRLISTVTSVLPFKRCHLFYSSSNRYHPLLSAALVTFSMQLTQFCKKEQTDLTFWSYLRQVFQNGDVQMFPVVGIIFIPKLVSQLLHSQSLAFRPRKSRRTLRPQNLDSIRVFRAGRRLHRRRRG